VKCERGGGDEIHVLRRVIANEVFLERNLERLRVFEKEGIFVWCDAVAKLARFGSGVGTFVLSKSFAESKVEIDDGIREARPM
jgi:hypothetical protein